MEKIYELITKKEESLEILEKEKKDLEQNMSNPTLLNNKVQEIKNVENKISLLADVLGLAEEAGDDSAEKILTDVKNHYEEMKQDFVEENKQKSLEDLNKLTQVLEDIINNDLPAKNESSKTTESDLKSDSSDDTDFPDFGGFDDTG